MAARDSRRILLLEEEIRNLSEELVQCQADKEFVWSLWKRLQVANPDLTQAVSLVVEREKQKGEAKDRKVLEILQSKDYKLQEFEQRVTSQQEEINSNAQRARLVEEGNAAMMKDMAALHHKLKGKSQELKECKEHKKRREVEHQGVVRDLEEAKAGLETRCAKMQSDLEGLLEQAVDWAQEKSAIHSKAQVFENDLKNAKQQVEDLQKKCNYLTAQLSATEKDLTQRDDHMIQLRQDQQQLQVLYAQSVEHASDQAQLIKQLEGLNLDTQRVLRTQEAAHSADSVSYQRLYSELSEGYQSLKASEAQLRQTHISLTTQLCLKDQQILHLQTQLQQSVTAASSPIRQSNCQQSEVLQKQGGVRVECEKSEEPPVNLSLTPRRDTQPHLRRQGAPGHRTRSLSPANGSGVESARGLRWAGQADARVRDLEEMLHLKTEENAELRKAHENRQERLRAIQANYKTVREQLKQAEESQGLARGRNQRAEAWELRQENSDGVWNELAYFKRLNKNIITEKTNLEEEVDVLRVQVAVDRVTLQEMRMCLQQKHQELLLKDAEGIAVTSSSTSKAPSGEVLENTALQAEQLQKRVCSLEKEAEILKQTNQEMSEARERLQKRAWSLEKEAESFREANRELLETREQLQTSLLRLRSQGAVQQQADRAWHHGIVQELERELGACRKQLARVRREGTQMRNRLERARQDLRLLRAARDYSHSRSHKHHGTTAASPKGSLQQRQHPHPTRCRGHTRLTRPSTSKDGWEDISIDSDSVEEYTDSLNSLPPAQAQSACDRHSGNSAASPHTLQTGDIQGKLPEAQRGSAQVQQGLRVRRRGVFCRALKQRISALQQQVAVLQASKKAAERSAQDLRLTQEKMTSQLSALTQRLNSSKQLSQKLASDLTASEQQKGELQCELEDWRQRSPHTSVPQNMEAELKGLHAKLKTSCNEVAKHTSANKTLKTELQAKEEQVKELYEKVSHMERDVTMKRQLVEDLRSKMKTFQDNDKNHKDLIEDLEKKVKIMSEEAANRKAFIDSLKRRLSVMTKERNQYEMSSQKLKKQLDKKDQKAQALHSQVLQSEQSMAELECTASLQMHGLAQQSTQAMDTLQRKLTLANTQLEQLHTFIQALAGELHLDIQEMRSQLRKHRRRKQPESSGSSRSKESLMRAQSIAASILNVSCTDLQDILDPEQDAEAAETDRRKEQDWLDQVMTLMQQQVPSVCLLMEVMRSKLRERKILTEELVSIRTHAGTT